MDDCLDLPDCKILTVDEINLILKANDYIEVDMRYSCACYLPNEREQSDLLFDMEILQKGSPYEASYYYSGYDFDGMTKFLVNKNHNELIMVFPEFMAKIKLDWFLYITNELGRQWNHYYDGMY